MFGAIAGAVGGIAGGKNPLEAVTGGFDPAKLLGGLSDPSKLLDMAAPMLGPYAGIAKAVLGGNMDPANLASSVFGKEGPMQKEGAMSVDQLLQQILGGNKEGAQAPVEGQPAGEPAVEGEAPATNKEADLGGIKDILTQIMQKLTGEQPAEKQAEAGEAPADTAPAGDKEINGDLIKQLLTRIEDQLGGQKEAGSEPVGDEVGTGEVPEGGKEGDLAAITDLLTQIKSKLGGEQTEEGASEEKFGGTNGSEIKKMFGF